MYRLYRLIGDDLFARTAALFDKPAFWDPLLAGADPLPGLHANTHLAQARWGRFIQMTTALSTLSVRQPKCTLLCCLTREQEMIAIHPSQVLAHCMCHETAPHVAGASCWAVEI